MKSSLAFCSIATRSHMKWARATALSTKSQYPDAIHYVLFVDEHPEDRLPVPIANEQYLRLSEIIPDQAERQRLRFVYTAFEICCALKPLLAAYVLNHFNPDTLVYLDTDMALHAPLPSGALPSGERSFVLTPHWLAPQSATFEAHFLRYGTFNAGYFAVSNDRHARDMLSYWWERCRLHAPQALEEGLCSDQSWLMSLPCLFGDRVAICRDMGVNVSWWNLANRHLHFEGDSCVLANGTPLVLMHWSQIAPFATGSLFPGDGNAHWTDSIRTPETLAALRRLYATYLERASKADHPEFVQDYRFNRFNCGAMIKPEDRTVYRRLCIAGRQGDGDPFAQAPFFAAYHRAAKLSRARSMLGRAVRSFARSVFGAKGEELVNAAIRSVRK